MADDFDQTLRQGLHMLGATLDAEACRKLGELADLLGRWRAKINLTAISAPADVAEKHIVDSLAILPLLNGCRDLLDIGSGAGFPGLPVACALPGLAVTCCESVGKKAAFIRQASTQLGLDVRVVQARALGRPTKEGLSKYDAVVSRAVAEPAAWLRLGACYARDGGRVIAMVGRESEAELGRLDTPAGWRLSAFRPLRLPVSGAERGVAVWERN